MIETTERPPARPAAKRRVALVHYWLVGMRGGEKVLEALCELFPDADVFTLVADPDKLSPTIRRHRITTSFLQRIGGRRHYQKMLPLMPFALESFDLSAYDLVISSEAGPAKGIIPRPDAIHVCYCHSPMRYVWDLYPEYRRQSGPLVRAVMSLTAPALRQWDVTTAQRVDRFIANSHYVARRIEKYYRRDATVIHPPVDVDRFVPGGPVGDFHLCAGQVTPYKRLDLAIEAFNRMGRPLLVVGQGADADLRRRAGATIRFVPEATDADLATYFRTCRALIYPGVEDFGIIPVEVMASGRPVIAYNRGGATETVVHGRTGLLFDAQTPESLIEAVETFETNPAAFEERPIRDHAVAFAASRFKREMAAFLESAGWTGGVGA